MSNTPLPELDPPYTVFAPETQTTPFVFCSPHSGRIYPDAFLAQSKLNAQDLRKSEDFLVDELFASAPEFGAPLIAAKFPRAYVDVNREPYELDPLLIKDPLPDYANAATVRVVGGLGTVARIVADGEGIYDAPIALADVLARVELYYKPFHSALKDLLKQTEDKFGYAVLIDCHSMPSQRATRTNQHRPDCVLGDRFGTACDPDLVRVMRTFFKRKHYDVHLNRPYAGGFITEHYGRPVNGVHAIQVELNRGLYACEETLSPNKGFETVRAHMRDLINVLTTEVPELLGPSAAAAE